MDDVFVIRQGEKYEFSQGNSERLSIKIDYGNYILDSQRLALENNINIWFKRWFEYTLKFSYGVMGDDIHDIRRAYQLAISDINNDIFSNMSEIDILSLRIMPILMLSNIEFGSIKKDLSVAIVAGLVASAPTLTTTLYPDECRHVITTVAVNTKHTLSAFVTHVEEFAHNANEVMLNDMHGIANIAQRIYKYVFDSKTVSVSLTVYIDGKAINSYTIDSQNSGDMLMKIVKEKNMVRE